MDIELQTKYLEELVISYCQVAWQLRLSETTKAMSYCVDDNTYSQSLNKIIAVKTKILVREAVF